MTEAEWQACGDPQKMLKFLGDKASERKLRLFACACVRRMRRLRPEMADPFALDTCERYVDGRASKEHLRAARKRGTRTWVATTDFTLTNAEAVAAQAAEEIRLLADDPTGDIVRLQAYYPPPRTPAGDRLYNEQRGFQCGFLRDIFGNPFRPVAIERGWLAWNDATPPRIALAIYDEKRFGDLPILADALEEAGCANPDLLNHCRQPGEHVRGCWVVDLALGRR